MAIGESRTELLAWLNATLELNYRKVEECGSGAAFCQLLDCVFGNVPMNKVNFAATSEYDFRQNWKVLQAQFTKHHITKVIDVEKLMKCRLQDNLELLQWFKRLWSEQRGNVHYDPKSRRKGVPAPAPAAVTPKRTVTPRKAVHRSTPVQSREVSREFQPREVARDPDLVRRLDQAQAEIEEYRVANETLETERNFYFNKLREIEILVQNIGDLVDRNDIEKLKELTVMDLTRQVQGILYSTEEGFQTVDENILDESF